MNIKTALSLLALAVAPFAFAEGDKPDAKHEPKSASARKLQDAKVAEKAGVDEATRGKIKAANAVAAKDPEFIKAREAAKAAQEKARAEKTPESRAAAKAAHEAVKKAHDAAMIKADPSIAEPLAKLEKAREELRNSCADCDKAGDKECKDCDGDKGAGHKGKKGPKADKKPEAAQS